MKNSENVLILKFGTIQKNFLSEKFRKFLIQKLLKIPIRLIRLIWEMIKFSKLFNLKDKRIFKILQFQKLSNILGVQIISEK